jgi:hypothetical protein
VIVSPPNLSQISTRCRSVRAQACVLVQIVVLLHVAHASALDKQGSAHGGQIGGAASGFGISGSLLLGAAIYNPTYAARPDNTGHALLRFAPHLDIDLIGSRLSIPIDINVFSDRDRPGAKKLLPSELDLISGLTSTWPLGPTAIEFGARAEFDLPVDRGSYSQRYVDARARWMFALSSFLPGLSDALLGGDITGSATLGWFVYNPTYAARPDNTGKALFRYVAHVNLNITPRYFFGLDTVFFTDRRENPFAPSECDFTVELGAEIIDGLQAHLAYERDMPIDRGSFTQHFLLLFFTWGFSLVQPDSAVNHST